MLGLLLKICSLALGLAGVAGLYFLTRLQPAETGAWATLVQTAKFICIGAILFAVYEWLLKKLLWSILFPKPLRIILAVVLGSALVLAALLETAITVAAGNSGYPAPDDECILIAGDAFENGKLPSGVFRKLDTALRLYRAEPRLPLLVSGGSVPGDRCSQALAMKQYLIFRGVPPEQIMVEETALSLPETFRRSEPVLDARFGKHPHRVVLITEAHEIFRAVRTGKRAGCRVTPHAPAADWRSWLAHPREWVAIVRTWFTP